MNKKGDEIKKKLEIWLLDLKTVQIREKESHMATLSSLKKALHSFKLNSTIITNTKTKSRDMWKVRQFV